ncbi:MAG: helix-turn-helix domain-containing protein [Desulfobulbaceae bacterium]|nr:MAG: helix-turn-helix domain-containing protein [Desulfobulbaceae bacterium]
MEWTELLRRAVAAEGSQGKVADSLGYSRTTLSMVLAGSYPADTTAIRDKVMEVTAAAG